MNAVNKNLESITTINVGKINLSSYELKGVAVTLIKSGVIGLIEAAKIANAKEGVTLLNELGIKVNTLSFKHDKAKLDLVKAQSNLDKKAAKRAKREIAKLEKKHSITLEAYEYVANKVELPKGVEQHIVNSGWTKKEVKESVRLS